MRIGIVGAGGRMGRTLITTIAETSDVGLSGAVDRPDSGLIGSDAGTMAGVGPLGITVGSDTKALFAQSDAVIDFTVPTATLAHAALAAETGTIHVIGTTGLSPEQESDLARAAAQTRIVYAPNMSAGVTLLMALTEQVAAALGPDYDIEIVEMHHRHKVDAPSGTALGLGRAAAAGRGVDLDTVAQRTRDGHTGPRKPGEIGFATLRGGDVVGDHSVIFATAGERLELTHKSSNRSIYGHGAIRAALWVRDKTPGLYSMRDVLGLTDA